ncbi:hypothetical protein BGZ88_002416 [Linnemannia elongata]|nr:hypothetical protein BGZ88_002416 [Linnemannia elongata]
MRFLGGGAEQQAPPPPPKCKPSTLTWYARATEASKYKPSSVGYGLTIRNTYQGYIPVQGFRTVKVLQSSGKKFSVKHGDIAKSRALALIWGDQLFKFTESNFAQSGMSGIKEMISGADEELPDCKPTTLTWTNRATKYTGWIVSHEAFTVTIRNTYYGSIPLRLHSEHSEANDIRANWTKEYFIEYDYWLLYENASFKLYGATTT